MLAGQAMKPEFEFSEPTLKSDTDISMYSPRVRLLDDLKQRQFFIRNYGPAILEYSELNNKKNSHKQCRNTKIDIRFFSDLYKHMVATVYLQTPIQENIIHTGQL